ncbi:MAG TPA: NAD(P)-binding domain-containing protein [Steroidobacter sp.]|uniref:NAD(P)-binding domain-containing protein n=1 Tax=Steroidobacter sp. TaxID=1978227 RepID=UPI002ED77995
MSGAARERHVLARRIDVVVIGAGHAGLAMSRYLSQHAIDHVVLERGEIANSWRRERWDSLRLLTPNWQSRLPGYRYEGVDPDGYMAMPEVIEFIDGYARFISAPVQNRTTVFSVRAREDRYDVISDRGRWNCRAVVIASGAHGMPNVPALATALPASVRSLTTKEYRNPSQLDDRGVLVVGASASGVQLADEIHRSGRAVTLAVGEHIRMPRVYRGLDIQWWLDACGILDERYDEVDDIVRARRVPSPQLIGTAQRAMLDLNGLTERGVAIVGRLVGIRDGRAQFSGSLRNHCAMADLKLERMLDRIDAWVEANGKGPQVGTPERFVPTHVEDAPPLSLDFARGHIGTVLWATGSRPDYSWLHVPAFDHKGRLRHDGGIVDVPGLYVLGLTFMRRRKSSFIHGAEDDARELSTHLANYLRGGMEAPSFVQRRLSA